MKYLTQFVVGSSYLVFAPFFYSVQQYTVKNYDYYHYTLVAPLWFGIWNIISLVIADMFNLTMQKRFFIISIISSISIMIKATLSKSYNFTKDEWNRYYLYIFIKYMVVWNLIIYNIERNIM